ncbi:HlyD family secretion protein [Sulfuritortus calidifontis]|uniref:HlyD family secretion protein n=1 Tax=Sulfuritortus calidifontis TaxID=1914471 RepID=A0A4R3JX46_9PROT|nr:HlyD family secretion protein [Sulfuritortus calidifontis]
MAREFSAVFSCGVKLQRQAQEKIIVNKTLRRGSIILALLVLAAAAVWWLSRPKPIPVVLHTVGTGRVEATVANTRAGTVEACQRTKLSTMSGGRIDFLGAREGDRVKKGQVLLRLWNEDLMAQVRLAEAQLATARKQIGEACALAEVAEREAERAAKLKANGFISVEREDSARAEAKAKRASCETAQTNIRQAEARLELAQAELKRMVLVAPFDGIVAEVSGELGEISTPSPPGIPTPPAIDLIDDSCLYVLAPMDEVDAPSIKLGQPARITLDAYPGRHFPAHVKRVAPYVVAVEKQSRTVDVEVAFDHPKELDRLLVGYSADAEVVLGTRDKVLRVPTPALLEGKRVLVYREADGRLEERQLKTGLSNWEYTEVLEGLKPGERIVASLEREGVKAGARVMPESAKGR